MNFKLLFIKVVVIYYNIYKIKEIRIRYRINLLT